MSHKLYNLLLIFHKSTAATGLAGRFHKVDKDLSKFPCGNFSVVIKMLKLQSDAIRPDCGINSSSK